MFCLWQNGIPPPWNSCMRACFPLCQLLFLLLNVLQEIPGLSMTQLFLFHLYPALPEHPCYKQTRVLVEVKDDTVGIWNNVNLLRSLFWRLNYKKCPAKIILDKTSAILEDILLTYVKSTKYHFPFSVHSQFKLCEPSSVSGQFTGRNNTFLLWYSFRMVAVWKYRATGMSKTLQIMPKSTLVDHKLN